MSRFSLRYRIIDLPLRHTFTISRLSRDFARNVFIQISADGIEGLGEAAPNHRYDETPDSVVRFLQKVDLSNLRNPFDIQALLVYLDGIEDGQYAAKAGLEMAFWDWIGKRLNIPLYKLWNAPSNIGPQTSVTIGISDNPEQIEEKINEFKQFPILKVKLGSADDKQIIRTIRSFTKKTIWVDANEGWKTEQQAKDMVDFLSDQNVGMIEQPMPAAQIDTIKKLRSITRIPFIADEGFTGKESLQKIAEAYDGINIKLMKVGSMRRAIQIIMSARKMGLRIMVGCMLESGLANTAAANVSLWADYADIDGPMLLSENLFLGFQLTDKKYISVNEKNGLGVSMIKAVF